MFGEVGVARAKTTDIAARAEVSVGSLYHLFSDKETIASALADRYLAEAAEIYTTAARHLSDPSGVPSFVTELLSGLMDLNDLHPGYLTVTRHHPSDGEGPSSHVRRAQIDALTHMFRPLAPDTPDEQADLIASNCVDIARALLERTPRPGPERQRFLDEFVQLVLAYLSHRIDGVPSHG